MRGLPPQPTDVAHLVQSFDISGHTVSVGFWLFSGAWPDGIGGDLGTAIADWLLFGLPPMLELMHTDVVPTTCQLALPGNTLVEAAPPARGAWSGGQPDNCALGLCFHTGDLGRGANHITFVPGVPSVFISDHYRLNELGWGNAIASSRELLAGLNAIRAPDGLPAVAGTLRRQAAGAPLTHAQFSPFFSVSPTPKLVTIRRRIPRTRAISSSA